VASGVPSGFTFSVSWEVNGRLELDVPYFNQNDIPTIGSSACASASTAMVLAYHARVRADKNSLMSAAQACFYKTSTLSSGLSSASALTKYLQNTYGIPTSYDESGAAQTYAIIQSEIRAGRPVIFGSHALTPTGHYLVVTGFNGNDYRTAKIIVNDPNGRWQGCSNGVYCYSTRDNGKGNEYSFATAINSSLHRIFLIRP
jgi:hypothetical protein